jgi:hypothetical protein
MIWEEFERDAPELAAFGRERFERSGLALVGTLRKNGWPRISPVEPLIADGHLYLGMMWRSRKALDLLRDPRCSINSVVSNRDAKEGEFKLSGRALDIQDPAMRRSYSDALYEKIGWSPEESEYHLFSIDILAASSAIVQNEEWIRQTWADG